MDIKEEDLEKIVEEIKMGVNSLGGDLPNKIVLLTEDVQDMVHNGKVVGALADMLDEILPMFIEVKGADNYVRQEGDYSIDLTTYHDGKFSSPVAS